MDYNSGTITQSVCVYVQKEKKNTPLELWHMFNKYTYREHHKWKRQVVDCYHLKSNIFELCICISNKHTKWIGMFYIHAASKCHTIFSLQIDYSWYTFPTCFFRKFIMSRQRKVVSIFLCVLYSRFAHRMVHIHMKQIEKQKTDVKGQFNLAVTSCVSLEFAIFGCDFFWTA